MEARLSRLVSLIWLVVTLAVSGAMWLGLSSLYDNAIFGIIKFRCNFHQCGSVNQMTLAIAFVWSILCAAVMLRIHRHLNLRQGIVFIASSLGIVLFTGALTFLAVELLFQLEIFGRVTAITSALSILLLRLSAGYVLATFCLLPALKWQRAPERFGNTLLWVLIVQLFCVAVVMLVAPGITISDRPFL